MNKRTWIAFLAAGVFAINGLALFLVNGAKETEKKRRQNGEIELSKKMVELSDQQGQIATLTKQKIDLEEQLSAKIASLEAALEEAEIKQGELSESSKSASAELESLKKDISSKDSKIAELTRRIRALEADKSDLMASLEKMKSAPAAGLSEGVSFSEEAGDAAYTAPAGAPPADSVKLGKIVVQKTSGRAARVEYVDKLYGFIVVNVGYRDGLRDRHVINILRGNRLIGKAVAHKVRQDVSAATLLPDWAREEVKVGDNVSRFN